MNSSLSHVPSMFKVGMLAIWLTGILISSIFVAWNGLNDGNHTFIIKFISLSWPLILFPFDIRMKSIFTKLLSKKHLLIFLYMFILSGVMSLFRSPEPLISAGHLLTAVLAILLAFIFIIRLNMEELRFGFILYGVAATIIIANYAWLVGLDVTGRLADPLNPNSVGLILISVIFSLFLIKNKVLRLSMLSIPVYILYMTNSRAAITGLIAGVIIYMILTLPFEKKRTLISVSGVISIVLLTIIFFREDLSLRVYGFVRDVYAIDDPWRGLSTGGTGRFVAWREAWGIFLESPMFGRGYRMHERFMVLYSSAHNGYLAVLADTGILGLSAVFYALFVSVSNITRVRMIKFNAWSLGFISSYMILVIFERYFINLGNPTSALFILLLVYGLSKKSDKEDKTGNAREYI